MANLLYEELTEKIRRAAFEVHSYFGSGYLEKFMKMLYFIN